MRNLYPELPTSEELAIILKEFSEAQGLESVPCVTFTVVTNTDHMENLSDSVTPIRNTIGDGITLTVADQNIYGRKLSILFKEGYTEPLTIIALPKKKEPVIRCYFPELANELAEEE